jgi:hypothetical protein
VNSSDINFSDFFIGLGLEVVVGHASKVQTGSPFLETGSDGILFPALEKQEIFRLN